MPEVCTCVGSVAAQNLYLQRTCASRQHQNRGHVASGRDCHVLRSQSVEQDPWNRMRRGLLEVCSAGNGDCSSSGVLNCRDKDGVDGSPACASPPPGWWRARVKATQPFGPQLHSEPGHLSLDSANLDIVHSPHRYYQKHIIYTGPFGMTCKM